MDYRNLHLHDKTQVYKPEVDNRQLPVTCSVFYGKQTAIHMQTNPNYKVTERKGDGEEEMHTSLPGAQREGRLQLGPEGSQIRAADRREGRWRCVLCLAGRHRLDLAARKLQSSSRRRTTVAAGGARGTMRRDGRGGRMCRAPRGIRAPPAGIAALGRGGRQWPLVQVYLILSPLCSTSRPILSP